MRAALAYHHKASLQDRYVLEMILYKVSALLQYPDGVKYRFIMVDINNNERVLMDNHYPKGPHIHINSKEMSYTYVDEVTLIEDFQMLVFKHMGVNI